MYFARRFLRLTSCLSFYLSLYFMCYLLYRGPFASYMENGTKRRGSVTRFDRSRSTRSGHRIGQQHQRRRRQGRRRPLHRMSHSSQSFVPQTAVDPQRKPEKKIFFFFLLFCSIYRRVPILHNPLDTSRRHLLFHRRSSSS